MRIQKLNEHQLTLTENRLFQSILTGMIGCLFLVSILVMTLLMPSKSTLSCSHFTNLCTLQQKPILSRGSQESFSLNSMKQAQVVKEYRSKQGYTHHLQIQFNQLHPNLNFFNTSEADTSNAAGQINHFLSTNSQPELYVELSQEPFLLLLTILFGFAALVLFFLTCAQKTVTFNKSQQQMLLENKWLMGSIQNKEVYALEDIQKFSLKKTWIFYKFLQYFYVCQATLKSGRAVPLHFEKFSNEFKAQEMLNSIESFVYQ